MLAGRLAGVLFLTAGVTALGMLLLPGSSTATGGWVVALAGRVRGLGDLLRVARAPGAARRAGSGTRPRSARCSSSPG